MMSDEEEGSNYSDEASNSSGSRSDDNSADESQSATTSITGDHQGTTGDVSSDPQTNDTSQQDTRHRGQNAAPKRGPRYREEYKPTAGDAEGFAEKARVVDWNQYRDRTWGQAPLWAQLGLSDLDDLIGWANGSLGGNKSQQQVDDEPETNPMAQQNILLGLPNIPLPPSYLDVLSSIGADKASASLAESGEVAAGMALEDMVTAALLPLAELHVLRCRELETKTPRKGTKRRRCPVTEGEIDIETSLLHPSETSFQQWTLPPEEAILKLLEQGVLPEGGVDLIPSATRCLCDPSKVPATNSTNWTKLRLETLKMGNQLVRNNPAFMSAFLKDGYALPRAPAKLKWKGLRR